MLMTAQVPEHLSSLPDLDETSPPSHPLHSPTQHPSPHSYPISSPSMAPPGASAFPGGPGYSADIFSNTAPAPMYHTDHNGMTTIIHEDPMHMGQSSHIVSRFRGVSYNKGKWQAGVMHNGRWEYCELFDTEVAAAAAYDRAIRHLHPQDAEMYVNFKHGPPLAAQGGMSAGAIYAPVWDVTDASDDGQSATNGVTDGRAWSVQQPGQKAGGVPHRASSSNFPSVLPPGITVIPASMAPSLLPGDDGPDGDMRGRGMVKSASVSTLLAHTTLSDSSAVPMSAGTVEAPMMQWPHGAQVVPGAYPAHGGGMATIAAPNGELHNMSAASLLLGADASGTAAAAAQNPRLAASGMKRVASAVDTTAMRNMHAAAPPGVRMAAASPSSRHGDAMDHSVGTAGSGGGGSGGSGSGPRGGGGVLGVAEGGVRRVGSAQELASAVSKPSSALRPVSAGLAARATRTGATRASNRRANSRYAKDKTRDEVEKGAAKGAGKDGQVGGKAGDNRVKTEEEMHAERLQVYQALLAGQERLHEQMRAHQAQHEEQQRRAAQREAEKANEARRKEAAAAASASPHAAHAAPTSSGPAVLGGRGAQGSPEHEPLGTGPRRKGSARLSPGFPPTSEGSTGSGGKVPRRIPSEPHSLAAMGVAGMGGRHSPTVTRAMQAGGMRRVKSTHNFGHHQQQYVLVQGMPHISMAMPTRPHPMPEATLRASPSMPVFPTVEHRHESLETPLPNITEEREDPLKLPESVTSMFMDEAEHGSDDLLSLMKDLTDHGGPAGLGDLDLTMPLEDGAPPPRVSESSMRAAENAAHSNRDPLQDAAAMHAGDQQDAAQQHESEVDPAFFHVDGAEQMSMLDDDDFGQDPYSHLDI